MSVDFQVDWCGVLPGSTGWWASCYFSGGNRLPSQFATSLSEFQQHLVVNNFSASESGNHLFVAISRSATDVVCLKLVRFCLKHAKLIS